VTLVLDDRIYDISFTPKENVRTATLNVSLNGRTFQPVVVSGWRRLSLGASSETGYLWSARELVVLPHSAAGQFCVIGVDEDLLTVFNVQNSWLLVCETSIRRLVGSEETDRVELGDVVEWVEWEAGALHVHGAASPEFTLRVEGGRLISSTGS